MLQFQQPIIKLQYICIFSVQVAFFTMISHFEGAHHMLEQFDFDGQILNEIHLVSL